MIMKLDSALADVATDKNVIPASMYYISTAVMNGNHCPSMTALTNMPPPSRNSF
jgi:hypothetical protein